MLCERWRLNRESVFPDCDPATGMHFEPRFVGIVPNFLCGTLYNGFIIAGLTSAFSPIPPRSVTSFWGFQWLQLRM